MKQKTLWIVAALVFCLAYTSITIFPPTEYHTDRWSRLIVNAGIMLVFTGFGIFPLTAFVALFLPKKWSYQQRFNKVLPFFVILLGAFLIFAVLAHAS
jgi:uncharacterized membrane protein YqjE